MSQAIAAVVESRPRDLGGFSVRRVLPAFPTKMVGPFIFFDHMGPVKFAAGQGVDVRPHPHIGLATVTYLFDGALMHRDSLGTAQMIRPGDVNWMTAGRGIAHSERSSADDRAVEHRLHGVQSWVALPAAHEEAEPSFVHHPGATLPLVHRNGATLRVIAGQAYGARSPVATFSDTLYVAVTMPGGVSLDIPADHEERAIYIVDGVVLAEGALLHAGQLAVLATGATLTIEAREPTRLMLLGGAKLDGDRFVWWNFVSSSRERIERAKADWAGGRFATVPGETEWIPLPER